MTDQWVDGTGTPLPMFGVLDQHTGEWVGGFALTEREAWAMLLKVDCEHPWELAVEPVADADGRLAVPELVTCRSCQGEGTCWHCDQQCPTCDGTGKVDET